MSHFRLTRPKKLLYAQSGAAIVGAFLGSNEPTGLFVGAGMVLVGLIAVSMYVFPFAVLVACSLERTFSVWLRVYPIISVALSVVQLVGLIPLVQ
jgi:hypothetical protein